MLRTMHVPDRRAPRGTSLRTPPPPPRPLPGTASTASRTDAPRTCSTPHPDGSHLGQPPLIPTVPRRRPPAVPQPRRRPAGAGAGAPHADRLRLPAVRHEHHLRRAPPARARRRPAARCDPDVHRALGNGAARRQALRSRRPNRPTPQASEPWAVIVIHDSQRLTGSYDSIDAAHREAGKAGCGYHFVINNGSTEQDGRIELGYRWNYQEPGDFFEGPEAEAFNRRFRTIGICLIGDLDRQAPTGAQLRELDWLVRSLQAQYGIPTDRVFLDLGSDGDGIGAHFPHVAFRRGLEAGARLAQR